MSSSDAAFYRTEEILRRAQHLNKYLNKITCILTNRVMIAQFGGEEAHDPCYEHNWDQPHEDLGVVDKDLGGD